MSATEVKIRRGIVKDAQRISELAQSIALAFIVDEFTAEGRALYLQQFQLPAISKRLAADDFHWLVAERGTELIGVAAMQGNWHLYYLFVAKAYQRGGLAKRMWQILSENALGRDPPPRNFKANAPRYAIGAYTRLGFKADGETRDEKGVRYQPMVCPAKHPAGSRA